MRNKFFRKLLKYKETQLGLQIRLRRFDSDLGLHHSKAPQINVCGVFICPLEKPLCPPRMPVDPCRPAC